MKALIVEDEVKMLRILGDSLKKNRIDCVLTSNARESSDAISSHVFDVIILDLGLPDCDGLDLLKSWRESGFTEPVLILSARDAVEDRVRGLNLGADDYLPKPFSTDELLARIRSLTRRTSSIKQTKLEHRGIILDQLCGTVTQHGKLLNLTRREFSLLELLLLNKGRILSRTLIAERVWDSSYEIETNLIDVYIRRLRNKLESNHNEPLIRTQRGLGYQLL